LHYLWIFVTWVMYGTSGKCLCFQSSVAEDSVLLVYDAASLGNWFLTFWDGTVVSSSRVEMTRKTLEDESTTLSWNTRNKVLDAATHPRRIETSKLMKFDCCFMWVMLDWSGAELNLCHVSFRLPIPDLI